LGAHCRYKVFFGWSFNFVKIKASVAILGPKKGLLKVQLFKQLQDNENFMTSTFICLLPIEAGHIFKTKKLDLSINCMREVAELSKSAIFGGGDYNFRADCMMLDIKIFFYSPFTFVLAVEVLMRPTLNTYQFTFS
jgi:hypothetical protein